jgi:transcriptional regulator with XRE-family HTH domain
MSIESAEATADLADRLRKSLQASDTSIDRIADELGITPATVDAWLRGLAAPRVAHLMVWARVCRVPFEWLMGTEHIDG